MFFKENFSSKIYQRNYRYGTEDEGTKRRRGRGRERMGGGSYFDQAPKTKY